MLNINSKIYDIYNDLLVSLKICDLSEINPGCEPNLSKSNKIEYSLWIYINRSIVWPVEYHLGNTYPNSRKNN